MPQYSEYAPGEGYVPAFTEMSGAKLKARVLDAGCGTGKGAAALWAAGYRVEMVDLTDAGLVAEARGLPFTQACLWRPLVPQIGYRFGGKVDYVYCCDVLEHVPTPFTMLVVARLLEVASRGVFLSISLSQDQFGAWIGRPLHQTVQSFTAWRDQLREIAEVVEARDLLHSGLYFVRAQ